MLTYYLVRNENTKNIDAKIMKTKNGRFVLSSTCAVCGRKKSKFMKEQRISKKITFNAL